MVLESAAHQERNRPFRIAEPQFQRGVEIVRTRESFIKTLQRCVVIGPYKPVDDATIEVATDRHLQTGRFEDFFGCGERRFAGAWLTHDLDERTRLGLTETKTRESNYVRAFVTPCFARMHAKRFGAELDQDRCLAVAAG